MADETLLLLAREVRGKTLRILDGVHDADSRWVPPGLVNNIVWHAGHALVLLEHMALSPATGKPPGLPDGWFEMFSWKSRPTATTPWPPLNAVVEQLQLQLDHLLPTLSALTPERLAQPGNTATEKTLRFYIVHALHDEASHQGEMYLLRKMIARHGLH